MFDFWTGVWLRSRFVTEGVPAGRTGNASVGLRKLNQQAQGVHLRAVATLGDGSIGRRALREASSRRWAGWQETCDRLAE